MSFVSGVTLLCSVAESHERDGIDLLRWLNNSEAIGAARFFEVSASYGGNKHPQQYVFGAGVNYCDEDGLAAYMLAFKWQYPENAVLIIQPEDGPTRVWHAK